MQKSRSVRAPSITVIDIWRDGSTYILAGICVLFIVALIGDAIDGRMGGVLLNIFLIAGVCALFTVHCRRKTVVSLKKLKEYIASSVGTTVLNLHRPSSLDKLPMGMGGWTNDTLLLRHGDLYYLSPMQQLGSLPLGTCPVLVFRDDSGHLHLFGFGKMVIANVPHPLEAGQYKTAVYHGSVGPARFDALPTPKGRSTPK
jgi:hypothetical protein